MREEKLSCERVIERDRGKRTEVEQEREREKKARVKWGVLHFTITMATGAVHPALHQTFESDCDCV